MGTGRLNGSRFDLTVSLQHPPIAHRIDEWRESFARASELLFEATGGQHQLGTISVCPDATGTSSADFFLLPGTGQSASSRGNLGAAGFYGSLCSDERFRPFIVLHEFAHYAYDVADEHKGPHTAHTQCVGPIGDACIMEAAWDQGDHFGTGSAPGPLVVGRVSRFCTPATHDALGDTDQNHYHQQESCWTTMVGRPFGLTPPAGPPAGPAPGAAVKITWTILAPIQRFALVLDRSAAVTGVFLAEIKIGAGWWADAAVFRDQLGIVSFGDTPRTDVGIRTIATAADRAAIRVAVVGLQAGGARATGGALREALGDVLAAGPRAANQVLVLVTDGAATVGPGPDAVLPALLANGVRVYTVAVGPFADVVLLADIARTTGGAFFRVDPRLPETEQAFRVRTALQQISQSARDRVGFVAVLPDSVQPGAPLDQTVFIEEGSERALFAVSWRDPVPLRFEVVRPGDDESDAITPDAMPPGVRLIADEVYTAFEVEAPTEGEWRVRISADSAPGPVEHLVFVTSQHPRITGALRAVQPRPRVGDPVLLQLQVGYGHPLTGLTVLDGIARLPDGFQAVLRFTDDGDPDTGDAIREDGLYSALLRDTTQAGVYTVTVEVVSDGSTARQATGAEPPDPNETFPPLSVPAFRRRLETTFVITN